MQGDDSDVDGCGDSEADDEDLSDEEAGADEGGPPQIPQPAGNSYW